MRFARLLLATCCVASHCPRVWGALPIQIPSPAGGCPPDWVPTFGVLPGVDDTVNAAAVFDDGSGRGEALYVGGKFVHAGNELAAGIARWDGTSWSAVDPDEALGTGVEAIADYEDASGTGPWLYAAGTFTHAGGHIVNRIARWNGSHWHALGLGLDHTGHALKVFDDGSGHGPELYVAGLFSTAGSVPVNSIAKWDGFVWRPVGTGVSGASGEVFALAVFDDGSGSGPALYAGGSFTNAGGTTVANIAKWDGSSWSAVGTGLDGKVRTLCVFDDGSGPSLVAGGGFTLAGGIQANRVARWVGNAWHALGSGTDFTVTALSSFDDGSGGGDALYVGGGFLEAGGLRANHVAKWDGTSWSALAEGTSSAVNVLIGFDDGSGDGAILYAGGGFDSAGEVAPANHVARWDGKAWKPLGRGLNGRVRVVTTVDANLGSETFVGGSFTFAGDRTLNHVARWDGASLAPLGVGLGGDVLALAEFDDGRGGDPALYAAGAFTRTGHVLVNRVAKWDGVAWTPLGGGMNGVVNALAVFDDGSGAGDALYAAGEFTTAGPGSALRIAKWDGTQWSPVGGGLNDTVHALCVFAAGGTRALYAGGDFTSAGGIPAFCIARWTGSTWLDVGVGTSAPVFSLALYDDGSSGGTALYAGGAFEEANHVVVHHVAKWNGSIWSALGLGTSSEVYALAVHDDRCGSGGRLWAGGSFSYVGSTLVRHVAAWDGFQWYGANGGTDGDVLALASLDDGTRTPTLFSGGEFHASPGGDSFLARWSSPASVGTAYCACDGSGSPAPCGNSSGAAAGCANSTGSGAALTGGGSNSIAADDLTFEATGLVPSQSALLFAADHATNAGNGVPFGDGLRCAGGHVRRLGVQLPDASGIASYGPGLAQPAQLEAGSTRRFQLWYRDPVGGPCASGFNLSNGYEVSFTR